MLSPLETTSLEDEVPILIIGGGPSGLLLAFLLAQQGSKSQFNLLTGYNLIIRQFAR